MLCFYLDGFHEFHFSDAFPRTYRVRLDSGLIERVGYHKTRKQDRETKVQGSKSMYPRSQDTCDKEDVIISLVLVSLPGYV